MRNERKRRPGLPGRKSVGRASAFPSAGRWTEAETGHATHPARRGPRFGLDPWASNVTLAARPTLCWPITRGGANARVTRADPPSSGARLPRAMILNAFSVKKLNHTAGPSAVAASCFLTDAAFVASDWAFWPAQRQASQFSAAADEAVLESPTQLSMRHGHFPCARTTTENSPCPFQWHTL